MSASAKRTTAQPGPDKIVYVMRQQYTRDHHNTGTDFTVGEVSAGRVRCGAAIKVVDLADNCKVTTLLDQPAGVIRDLELSYDASTLLFAMRRNKEENFHIYRIGVDGGGLKKLTSGNGSADMDPVFLPDGRIVFSSTRDVKYCGCNQHIQANLFIMNADGTGIRQLGFNTLYESRPSMLPDGRILYDRWEYVDRHFGPSFGLWTMQPDGRNPALFYGNNAWAPGAIFDARILPKNSGGFYAERVVCTFGSCHDRPWGAIVILDRRRGLDGMEPLLRTWPADISAQVTYATDYGNGRSLRHPAARLIDTFCGLKIKYEDPYPLDEHRILCSRMLKPGTEETGIFLLDAQNGSEKLVHKDAPGCFDPLPLKARPKPHLLPDNINPDSNTGTFYVTDVYKGTGMEKVPRGSIKTLRIVEAPAKRNWTGPLWEADTLQRPAMNYNCTSSKRILGDVPIEDDGSAYFEMPANRFVFFQALDENGMMVQSMRSGTYLQRGEHAGCTGCHEGRYDGSMPAGGMIPKALKRPPDQLKPWHGPERDFNYLTEVQPVFDKHCVQCHDYGKKGEKALNLCGDLGMVFNVSFLEIRRRAPLRWYPDKPGQKKELVKAVDDGPPEVLPAYAWGACRSRLVDVIRNGHHSVKLSTEELDRIITWIDLNTPYYGSYFCNYPNNPYGRSPLSFGDIKKLAELTGAGPMLQAKGAVSGPAAGTGINFTRPENSACLQGMNNTNDNKYKEALNIIRKGQKTLYSVTRADMPEFVLRDPLSLERRKRYTKSQR